MSIKGLNGKVFIMAGNKNSGFASHPENAATREQNAKGGRNQWDPSRSYKYNLRLYGQMSLDRLVDIADDMAARPGKYTAHQIRALRDTLQLADDYSGNRDLGMRVTDHVVKKLYGTAPFLTEEDEGVQSDVPRVTINFVGGGLGDSE